MLAVYDKAVEAMRQGNVEGFKRLRDSKEIAKIEKIRSHQGARLDAESLKTQVQYWPDWKLYQQTGLVKSPNWIRVDFQRDSPERDATNKPRKALEEKLEQEELKEDLLDFKTLHSQENLAINFEDYLRQHKHRKEAYR